MSAPKEATESERRSASLPNLRPRDAATLILIDRSAPEPLVLMGRRKASLKFMPGLYVFPGGRVDAADADMSHVGNIDAARLRKATPKLTDRRAAALALAAIRETYEETGVLMGRRAPPARIPNAHWAPFAAHGVTPDLDALTYVCRAVTPPRRPRRFDTRFFVADVAAAAVVLPEGERPETDLEAVEWLTFRTARERPLPYITGIILDAIEPRLTAADWESDRHPVPSFVERYGRPLNHEH